MLRAWIPWNLFGFFLWISVLFTTYRLVFLFLVRLWLFTPEIHLPDPASVRSSYDIITIITNNAAGTCVEFSYILDLISLLVWIHFGQVAPFYRLALYLY